MCSIVAACLGITHAHPGYRAWARFQHLHFVVHEANAGHLWIALLPDHARILPKCYMS